LKKEKQRNTALVEQLENQLRNRKVDAALSDKLATIKLLLQQKHALHAKLTNTSLTFVSGFAIAMNELSDLHHKDVYLQGINIKNDDMHFSGLAKTPEAVPAWLDGFQQSTLLAGKSFVGFKLSKNDDNVTEFVVSSKVDKGAEQ
jgi:Tfp pilus assembly protein PilN